MQAYDFSGIQTLVDVGGGNGSNIAHILQQYPEMQGILFDLPHVVERAQPHIEAAGLSERCEIVGGNFFESVPGNADACMGGGAPNMCICGWNGAGGGGGRGGTGDGDNWRELDDRRGCGRADTGRVRQHAATHRIR